MSERASPLRILFPGGVQRREVALIVGLGFLAAFITLGAVLAGSDTPDADRDIARWIRDIDFWGWDTMVSVGEAFTGTPLGVIVWIGAVAFFWASGRPVEAIVLAFAVAIWLPKGITEELVSRSRPVFDGIDGSDFADGRSFPSGHLTAGIAVYGMLAVIAVARLSSWQARSAAVSVVAVILVLSAFSRVVDGVHWPSDVLGATLLGIAWVTGLAVLYLDMRNDHVVIPGLDLLRRLRRRGRRVEPADRDIAGSVASTVYLDRKAGTASKIYRPPRFVRWMYWAAFQSSFPYATREEALRTAAAVRELTGVLTEYWTGEDMVAAVTEIRCDRGEFVFVTELVEGEEPKDNAEVRDVLLAFRRRFAEAGLATWQIDPENPHAHTNFIRTSDGKLKLIDLESTLIPFVQPLAMLPRMFRMGRIPTFDDVDYERLRRYVEEHRADINDTVGVERLARLDAAIATAEACAATWKGDEPNVWGRAAHRVWHWIAWDRRTGPIRRRFAQSEDLALRFVMKPLDRWVEEGRITTEKADEIRESLESDSARRVLRFLGMHVAVSFLPGPPGTRSLARFGTVVAMRTRDTLRYNRGEISRAQYDESRSTHTWLVAVIGLVPAFGAGAYLLSPQMRRCSFILPLAFDRVFHRLPFRVYYRWRLHRFTVDRATRSLGPIASDTLSTSTPPE
jgi:undecaprenyl-diphosphatase